MVVKAVILLVGELVFILLIEIAMMVLTWRVWCDGYGSRIDDHYGCVGDVCNVEQSEIQRSTCCH